MSVLIFVDWVPRFIGASCPHSLGSDVGGQAEPSLSVTLIMHGPAARSLTAATAWWPIKEQLLLSFWRRDLPQQVPEEPGEFPGERDIGPWLSS